MFPTPVNSYISNFNARKVAWRYVALFCLTAAIGFMGVAAINVIVDPFGAFGTNRLGLYFSTEWEYKNRLVEMLPYDVLLLGSSKVTYIDPEEVAGLRVVNGAFSSALPEEMEAFLSRHVRRGTTVLIGLDFYMFNGAAFPPSRRVAELEEPLFTLRQMLGFGPLRHSIDTIRNAMLGVPPEQRANGARTSHSKDARDAGLAETDASAVIDGLRQNSYSNFRYAEWRLDSLRRIRALCEERQLRCIAFVNPLHHSVRGLITSMGLDGAFARFKTEVAAIFGQLEDFSEVGLDSDGLYWRHDPYHYRPQTGAIVLRRLLALPRRVEESRR